ncbi:MAG: phosphotransferase [Anaerolineales bacterium]
MLPTSTIIALPRPGWVSDFLNSRFRSLDIQLTTVKKVLSYYGLEMVASPKNLPNTRRNRNLIVHTSQGKKILKLYRDDWRSSTIAFEHSILGRLAELDFVAPRLLPTQDGRTWLNLDKHNYCLFEFIEGKNYSSTFLVRPHRVRMMATSGRTLARLHKQLAGFLPEGQHHLGFKNYSEDRHRDVAWHVEKIKEFSARSRELNEPDDRLQASWLVDHADQLLDEMRLLDESLRKAALPRIVIHGDYGLHNLIYQSLDTAIPVDYELSRLEWRLSDLVSVVSKFRYKDGSYDFESITRFMQAYQTEFPISDDEWGNFPLVWKYYKLMKAVQYWSSYFETNGPMRKLESSRDEIERSSWALNNPQRLAEFRRSAR